MIIFLVLSLCLLLGYFLYSKFVAKIFGASSEIQTPVLKFEDGVDYVKMPPIKLFLIQFLNIAGLGPVFGAILGAIYGPVALLWIVFGAIFAGGVYDYIAAMISIRNDGKSLITMLKDEWGKYFNFFFMIFLIFFLNFNFLCRNDDFLGKHFLSRLNSYSAFLNLKTTSALYGLGIERLLNLNSNIYQIMVFCIRIFDKHRLHQVQFHTVGNGQFGFW